MFLGTNFLARDRAGTLDWLSRFSAAVEGQQHIVTRFDPSNVDVHTNKVAGFEVIHVFSSCEPECWSVLKKLGPRVVVTPSLQIETAAQPDLSSRLAQGAIRVARAITQRRWPPIDETGFLSCADRYLVPSQQWAQVLRRRWKVASGRIDLFDAAPVAAAGQASALYRKLPR